MPVWGGGGSSFAEESTGALWVAGAGGAARFDFETWSWRRHRFTNSSMISYFVEAISFGPTGEVYLNGNAAPGMGGFNVFDGSDWVGVNDFNYGFGPAWGLPSDDASALCIRSNGNVAIIPTGQSVFDWDGFGYSPLIPDGYGPRRVVEDGLGRL
ncbi:MAG: hypothetical protein IPK83_10920 [Planctomycetes bacterium]|nr:hypothetical protein [Planctomycetota bacterium]